MMRSSSATLVMATCILMRSTMHTTAHACLGPTENLHARPDYAHFAIHECLSRNMTSHEMTRHACVCYLCCQYHGDRGRPCVLGGCHSQSVTRLCVTRLESVTTLPPWSSPFFIQLQVKKGTGGSLSPTPPSRLATQSSARV